MSESRLRRHCSSRQCGGGGGGGDTLLTKRRSASLPPSIRSHLRKARHSYRKEGSLVPPASWCGRHVFPLLHIWFGRRLRSIGESMRAVTPNGSCVSPCITSMVGTRHATQSKGKERKKDTEQQTASSSCTFPCSHGGFRRRRRRLRNHHVLNPRLNAKLTALSHKTEREGGRPEQNCRPTYLVECMDGEKYEMRQRAKFKDKRGARSGRRSLINVIRASRLTLL